MAAGGISLEDRLKSWLPAALYMRHKIRKERRRGEPELGILGALVRRDRIAIDAGANRGMYSYALARHAREVHAFEPHPQLSRLAARLLRGRAVVHPCALSDRNGSCTFRIPEGQTGADWHLLGTLEDTLLDTKHREVEVEARTLDSFAFEGVGFLKIDVEGHEQAVLAGARETIGRDRPTLLVELLAGYYADPAGIADSICREFDCQALTLWDGTMRSFSEFARTVDPASLKGAGHYCRNVLFLPR
jgi:FkbM family methyltransferase